MKIAHGLQQLNWTYDCLQRKNSVSGLIMATEEAVYTQKYRPGKDVVFCTGYLSAREGTFSHMLRLGRHFPCGSDPLVFLSSLSSSLLSCDEVCGSVLALVMAVATVVYFKIDIGLIFTTYALSQLSKAISQVQLLQFISSFYHSIAR